MALAYNRTRTKNEEVTLTGTSWRSGTPTEVSKPSGSSFTTKDTIGSYGDDHDFFSEEVTRDCLIYNGHNGSSLETAAYGYDNVPGLFAAPAHPYHIWNSGALATNVAARTNPSKAHVSVPNFLFELRDLPHLLRIAGNTKIKANFKGRLESAAGGHVSAQFGLLPLIGDLVKLVDFQAAVDRRLAQLKKMKDHGGQRRRVSLETKSWSNSSSFQAGAIPKIIIDRNYTSKVEVWATCRWIPQSGLPDTDEELTKLARKLILGFHRGQQAVNLWNAIPWTWLIDWFSEVGDFIESNNNSVAFLSGGSVCVMKHHVTRYTYTFNAEKSASWIEESSGGAYVKRDTKWRYAESPSPFNAHMPFLNGKQLSILGSLAILKGRGSSKLRG